MVVGEFTTETEMVVIGGGPGGYGAAFRAAELGIQTTIVEDRPRLGGTWLHGGCIPSKQLVRIADLVRGAAAAASFGVRFDPPRLDLERLREAMAETVQTIATELEGRCRERGVERLTGRARFENSRQLDVTGRAGTSRLRFRRAIIATGSRGRGLEGIDGRGPRVGSAASALRLEEIPRTLLIAGGSTAALELAGAFTALGSRVTVVDSGSELVPLADDDLVEPLRAQLAEDLEALHLATTVSSMTDQERGIKVAFAPAGSAPGAAPEPATYERMLVVAGRSPNLEGLGLERTQVQRDETGFILVDEQLRTTDPRLLAVGDVVGEPMLALKAACQGRVAAEVAAGWGSVFDVRAAPMVLFTNPPIAWCGLTTREAAALGQAVKVQRIGGAERGVPAPTGGGTGFTKLIYDPDTRLVLGVGIVGPQAAERIAEGALALEMGAVTGDLAATMHPHPTFSESLPRAAERAEPPPSPPA